MQLLAVRGTLYSWPSWTWALVCMGFRYGKAVLILVTKKTLLGDREIIRIWSTLTPVESVTPYLCFGRRRVHHFQRQRAHDPPAMRNARRWAKSPTYRCKAEAESLQSRTQSRFNPASSEIPSQLPTQLTPITLSGQTQNSRFQGT